MIWCSFRGFTLPVDRPVRSSHSWSLFGYLPANAKIASQAHIYIYIVQTRTFIYKTCKLCQITIYSINVNDCYFVLLFGHNDKHLHPSYIIVSCCYLFMENTKCVGIHFWQELWLCIGVCLYCLKMSLLSFPGLTLLSEVALTRIRRARTFDCIKKTRREKQTWSQEKFVHPRLQRGRFRFMRRSAHLSLSLIHIWRCRRR